MSRWIVVLTLIIISSGNSARASTCFSQLSQLSHRGNDPTHKLIAYLSVLLEQRLLGSNELARLDAALRGNKIENPFSNIQTASQSTALVHGQEIQRHLQAGIDKQTVLKWIETALKHKEQVQEARRVVNEKTESSYQKIEFLPVPAGKFKMGPDLATVELTHSFEMMSTPVTQKQWVELMGANPSHFNGGAGSMSITVGEHTFRMRPDNPVENVNWLSAVVFANKLSEKMGLESAYKLDLARANEFSDAKFGDLVIDSGTPLLNPNANIYEAKGYRLPTEAEFEYMLRLAGKSKRSFPFEGGEASLANFAWYDVNSNMETQPVGQLSPHIIGSGHFFDLLGNVSEWTHSGPGAISSDRDPIGDLSTTTRNIRGGSWRSQGHFLQAHTREAASISGRRSALGFRLVRTVK